MTEIRYLRGDATSPQAKGVKIIAHVSNDLGGWGKGFVLAISRRWSEPESQYRAWHRERAHNDFGLGATQFVQCEEYIWVANMIGQHGLKKGSKGPPVRYEAIKQCLAAVAAKAQELNASVHIRASVAVWRVEHGRKSSRSSSRNSANAMSRFGFTIGIEKI